MKVTVLGTGAADGIPQPFCGCTTCGHARFTGEVRCAGGVLLDDTVLIDAPPALGTAAARAGVTLEAVNTVLVTHSHPDHWDPSFLLYRQWQLNVATRPLSVVGPVDVIESAQQWLPPSSAVQLQSVTAGDHFRSAAGHEVRVLASSHGNGTDRCADLAVLFDVTGPDGARLLYASDTGVLPAEVVDAIRGARFDVVLLELTFGADGPTTAGHLDHDSFTATLATLRQVDAITSTSTVVAVHLGHHNPPTPALEAFLRSVGARCVTDGRTWQISPGEPMPADRRRVLILGGVRSGKSRHAEKLAAPAPEVTYVATGWPRGSNVGDDWDDRIVSHQARRPLHWQTTETLDIVDVLTRAEPGQTVLVDCLALWVTRLVDEADAWRDRDRATTTVTAAAASLCAALASSQAAQVFIVSNEVGSGVAPATASGGLFRDLLGLVNTSVANCCDEVLLMIAGRPCSLPAADTSPSAAPEEASR